MEKARVHVEKVFQGGLSVERKKMQLFLKRLVWRASKEGDMVPWFAIVDKKLVRYMLERAAQFKVYSRDRQHWRAATMQLVANMLSIIPASLRSSEDRLLVSDLS